VVTTSMENTGATTTRKKLYVITFEDDGGSFWTEAYLAENHDHAEEQCRNANPPDIKIIHAARIPFYMVERAYYLGKPR
jgi:hypothetical protein